MAVAPHLRGTRSVQPGTRPTGAVQRLIVQPTFISPLNTVRGTAPPAYRPNNVLPRVGTVQMVSRSKPGAPPVYHPNTSSPQPPLGIWPSSAVQAYATLDLRKGVIAHVDPFLRRSPGSRPSQVPQLEVQQSRTRAVFPLARPHWPLGFLIRCISAVSCSGPTITATPKGNTSRRSRRSSRGRPSKRRRSKH